MLSNFFNCLDYFSGIASNDHIVRDVMRDNRTGSNNYAVSYSNTRTNDYSAAEPAVISYPYRQTCFYGLTALQIIMRMVGCQQLAVGPDERVGAYGNTSSIQEYSIEINHRSLADSDPIAVVAMEWWHDDH